MFAFLVSINFSKNRFLSPWPTTIFGQNIIFWLTATRLQPLSQPLPLPLPLAAAVVNVRLCYVFLMSPVAATKPTP